VSESLLSQVKASLTIKNLYTNPLVDIDCYH
jgi:hypothetical protein